MRLHAAQVVNFGAWYPRYSVLDPHHPWPAWQTDMKELINERLVSYKATTFWRSYAAAHYGGTNGTNTFEEVNSGPEPLVIIDTAAYHIHCKGCQQTRHQQLSKVNARLLCGSSLNGAHEHQCLRQRSVTAGGSPGSEGGSPVPSNAPGGELV